MCTVTNLVILVRSIVTYAIVLAYILVAGPTGLLIAVVFRWKSGLYAFGHAGMWPMRQKVIAIRGAYSRPRDPFSPAVRP